MEYAPKGNEVRPKMPAKRERRRTYRDRKLYDLEKPPKTKRPK